MQPMPVQGEQHVPVRDFNAAEVKDFLKKRMSQLSKFPVLVLCLLKKEIVEVTTTPPPAAVLITFRITS